MPESAPVHAPRSTSKHRTPVQNAALVAGAVFLLVGVLGFVPGVTTHYDQLTFGGHHSDAALLGIFNVSILHNLVHLAFGVAGIALSRTFNSARAYLIAGGAVYLALSSMASSSTKTARQTSSPSTMATTGCTLGFPLP